MNVVLILRISIKSLIYCKHVSHSILSLQNTVVSIAIKSYWHRPQKVKQKCYNYSSVCVKVKLKLLLEPQKGRL